MVPMSSTEARFSNEQRRQLLNIARDSIQSGLRHGRPLVVDTTRFDEPLRAPGAAFVTLHRFGQLRGCIGSLEAYRPLVEDVAENAFAAAFRDPRFAPLSADEAPDLVIEISVLSPAEAMTFDSEADLLTQIRPGIDGLIIEDRGHRGTFLPSVWEQLPDKTAFWQHLKAKAGLPPNYWSDTLRVSRYTTESFS